MGVADRADRIPARRGARALRPVPRRGGGRQRRHLHRSLGTAGPHAGLLPHGRGRGRSHRDRGVRCADADTCAGEGNRADHRIALQRQQSGRTAVDPHHRLAFGAQVLRAATGPARCRRRRSRGSGRSRASPPSCRPANRPTFPRRATRCGSTSPTFAVGCAPPNMPTAQCITCCTRRGTAACGCGRAAGFWRQRRSRPCRNGCGTWAISISPPRSTPP